MRLFHHKEQCYIVAEGSFVGQCGTLPQGAADSGSFPKSQPEISQTALHSHEIQVKADVEPEHEESIGATSSLSPVPIESPPQRPLQPGGDSRELRISDSVVSEDGKQ